METESKQAAPPKSQVPSLDPTCMTGLRPWVSGLIFGGGWRAKIVGRCKPARQLMPPLGRYTRKEVGMNNLGIIVQESQL